MSAYELAPIKSQKAPSQAAECFIRTGGDAVGLVKILTNGKFECWRNGQRIGTFSTMGMMCRALDKLDL